MAAHATAAWSKTALDSKDKAMGYRGRSWSSFHISAYRGI
jgi:hypothetical protein